jgi:hypothetical protein
MEMSPLLSMTRAAPKSCCLLIVGEAGILLVITVGYIRTTANAADKEKTMWGIFLGSLLFVLGIAFSPVGLLVSALGMTLALMATARYAVDLLSPSVPAKKTIYDDMGVDQIAPEQPVA